MCSAAFIWKKTEIQRLKPRAKEGTVCSTVTLAGMRENLFTPIERSTAPAGSKSPVSRVNRPGLPSRAGMGIHLGTFPELSPVEARCSFAEGLAGEAGATAGAG